MKGASASLSDYTKEGFLCASAASSVFADHLLLLEDLVVWMDSKTMDIQFLLQIFCLILAVFLSSRGSILNATS